MPFVPAQQDPLIYDKLKKRQLFVWVFLLCMGLTIISLGLYVGYQFMKQGGSDGGIAQSTVVIPAIARSGSVKEAEARDTRYFLYGEFSPSDKRYRIYKVYYGQFSKGELFSFPWRDATALPEVVVYGDRLAVFTDKENGFLINRDGKISGTELFIPPSNTFTVSPNGKRMLYFKYLSSLGNTSLTVRDLEKNSDVFSWPMNASASALCSFAGWSGDSAQAYCTARTGKGASVKSFDAYRYTSTIIASLANALGVRYYSDHDVALFVERSAVVRMHTATKERKDIAVLAENEMAEDALLSRDGKTVFYTTHPRDGLSGTRTLYAVSASGGDARKIMTQDGLRLVSLAPDGVKALIARFENGATGVEHYDMVDTENSSTKELYAGDASSQKTQFIGWFKD